MEYEKIRQLIETTRQELHELVDKNMDLLCNATENNIVAVEKEKALSLNIHLGVFKGKKPVSVIFPDGREVMTKTWKQVAVALLQDCNADEQMHRRLSELSGKIFGRDRVILAQDACGLDAPLQIEEGIYFEGKFDTESLLRVVTERILKAVGYDYGGIRIKIMDPKQAPISTIEPIRDVELEEENCPKPGKEAQWRKSILVFGLMKSSSKNAMRTGKSSTAGAGVISSSRRSHFITDTCMIRIMKNI